MPVNVSRCIARLFVAAFLIAAYVLFAPFGAAQEDPAPPTSAAPGEVQADSGIRANGTYDGLNDHVNLVNGNLSFCIPLVSLPGPAMPPGEPNLDMNLPLCYNSEFVAGVGTGNGGVISIPLSFWNPYVSYGGPAMNLGWALTGHAGVFWQPSTTTFTTTPPLGGFLPDGSRFNTLTTSPLNGAESVWYGPDTGGQGLFYQTQDGTITGMLFMKNGIQYTGTCAPCSIYNPSTGTSTSEYNYNETESDTLGHTITWTQNSITDAVGRTVSVNVNSTTGTFTIQYPNPSATSNSASQDLTVTVQMGPVVTSNGCQFTSYGGNGSTQAPTAVILPDGLQYTFLYDNCGLLRLVQYPSGGYTRYDYQGGRLGILTTGPPPNYYTGAGFYQVPEIADRYVCTVPASPGGNYSSTTCPVPEEVTSYELVSSGQYNNLEVKVTDPIGNYTIYDFLDQNPMPLWQTQAVETERDVYDASGKLLRRVATQYLQSNSPTGCSSYNPINNPNSGTPRFGDIELQDLPTLPIVQDTTLYTTLDNSITAEIDWSYSCNPTWQGPTVLTDKKEYDYGSGSHGALLKETKYDWLVIDANAAYYLPPIIFPNSTAISRGKNGS